MWGSSILPIAALAALPCTTAITLHKRSDPAVLGLPVTRTQRPNGLQKRDSKIANTTLYNVQNTYYMVNITIGTPPQNLSLSLDTGSSDTWVNVPNSTYCSVDNDPCASTGEFNLKDSSSFNLLDYSLNASYVGGFLAAGPYATDDLSIGGAKVKDFQFALGDTSLNDHGILGVGYANATYASGNLNKEYDNLPKALVKSGAIKSAAYSLWLNKYDDSGNMFGGTGNLLFGGVNKARYSGDLQTVPVLKLYGEFYYSLAIALTDITVKDKTYGTGLPLAVSLDTGSPFIALPKEVVDPIYKAVGAGYASEDQSGYIPCDAVDSDYNVTFSFSGAKVSIPISELVFKNAVGEGTPKGDCIFGITYSQPGVNLMGDPFLRGAYVVYDLENNEISLANANFDGGDDDIYEIGTGSDSVPGAKKISDPVTSATGNGKAQTATALASTMTHGTATADATATNGAGSTDTGSATSTSSEGMAAMPTSNPGRLLPGLLGAGLLLAL